MILDIYGSLMIQGVPRQSFHLSEGDKLDSHGQGVDVQERATQDGKHVDSVALSK